MTKTCRNVLIFTNIISLLVWGVLVGVFWCKHLPETKQSPEEVKARIESVSNLEKAQQIAIAEDNYIRTLENIGFVFRDVITTLGLFGGISAVANISLALQKPKREESSEK
jgi:hypothetical protein